MIHALRALLFGLSWDRPQLAAFRDNCLQELIHHSYSRVPYYRRLLDAAGVRPEDIRGVRDLERIPVSSRAGLQQATEADRLAYPGRIMQRTSGTSGEPLAIRRTLFEERLLAGIRVGVEIRYGYRPWEQRAAVSMAGPGDHAGSPIYTRFGLLRRPRFDASDPEAALALLRRSKPVLILGYPNTLARVAELAAADGGQPVRPRFICCGGETMRPEVRGEIARAFACPVLNTYGTSEANLLAWECPETGYFHVCDHSVVLEVLAGDRPAKPGETGDVVITSLHSRAMPFIRYRIHDLATLGPSPCPCGHPSMTLSGLEGRSNEWFYLPDGRMVHPFVALNAVMEGAPWAKRVQILQSSPESLEFRVGPSPGVGPEDIVRLERFLASQLDSSLRIEVQTVDELRFEASGKFRVFVPMAASGSPRARD